MNLSSERVAQLIARSPRAAAVFDRLFAQRAMPRRADLVKAGKRYADWFLRNGTTTIEAKSGYGLTLEDELKILRAIRQLNDETPLRYVPTFLGAHDIPSEYKSRRHLYVTLVVNEMLPRVSEESWPNTAMSFAKRMSSRQMKPGRSFPPRVVMAGVARACGSAFTVGRRKAGRELNAATADHLEHTDAAGIMALKAAKVQPVLCCRDRFMRLARMTIRRRGR